jgi:hypothetical protein
MALILNDRACGISNDHSPKSPCLRPAHNATEIQQIASGLGLKIATWRCKFKTPAAGWELLQARTGLLDHVVWLLDDKKRAKAILSAKYGTAEEHATKIAKLSAEPGLKVTVLPQEIYPRSVTILIVFTEK